MELSWGLPPCRGSGDVSITRDFALAGLASEHDGHGAGIMNPHSHQPARFETVNHRLDSRPYTRLKAYRGGRCLDGPMSTGARFLL